MTPAIPDPYDHTTCNGKPLDWATTVAIRLAERELGYELTILQGIGGASASAGTHLEGRAVDLSRYDAEHKMPVLERIGFAAWERDDLPGVWSEHIHAVLMFEDVDNSRGLADSGFRQIASFLAGRDGLADNGFDLNKYRPSPHALFTREDYRKGYLMAEGPKPTTVQRARNNLVDALESLGRAAVNLERSEDRPVALAAAADVRAIRRTIRAKLDHLPKK